MRAKDGKHTTDVIVTVCLDLHVDAIQHTNMWLGFTTGKKWCYPEKENLEKKMGLKFRVL